MPPDETVGELIQLLKTGHAEKILKEDPVFAEAVAVVVRCLQEKRRNSLSK